MLLSHNMPVELPSEFALINGKIITSDGIISGKNLLIRNGKIDSIVNIGEYDLTIPEYDVRGAVISPGFIDIHIHGAAGHTFNELEHDAYSNIIYSHLKHGTTSLIATVATAPIQKMLEALNSIHKFRKNKKNLINQCVAGIHIEGPFFSSIFAGAQDTSNLLLPNSSARLKFLKNIKKIKIFSLAPELPGAIELIKAISSQGVIVAAGHSNARDSDVILAMKAGLSHIIHIWNAQSMTIREGVWRKPGLLEASLTFDGLTVEMIADNKHLPPTLMKLAMKSIGVERLCLISDATAGAGLKDQEIFKMGDVAYKVKDGVGMTLDETSFAGSTTFLNQMIKVLVKDLDVPLREAVTMCTSTPAKIVGLSNKGSLKNGMDADIVVFDENTIEIRATIIQGRKSIFQ